MSILTKTTRNNRGNERPDDLWIPDFNSFLRSAGFLLLSSMRGPIYYKILLFKLRPAQLSVAYIQQNANYSMFLIYSLSCISGVQVCSFFCSWAQFWSRCQNEINFPPLPPLCFNENKNKNKKQPSFLILESIALFVMACYIVVAYVCLSFAGL